MDSSSCNGLKPAWCRAASRPTTRSCNGKRAHDAWPASTSARCEQPRFPASDHQDDLIPASRVSSANASCDTSLKRPAARSTSISRFQEFVLTTLGTTSNGCFSSRNSWNACWLGLTLPERNQFGLATVDTSSTCTFDGSVISMRINWCGTKSKVLKPLWTATSRMAVEGSMEV